MTQKRVQPNTAIDMRGATGEQWDEVERVLNDDGYQTLDKTYKSNYIAVRPNCYYPISYVPERINNHINHTDLCT